jgi:hypothetical protein
MMIWPIYTRAAIAIEESKQGGKQLLDEKEC